MVCTLLQLSNHTVLLPKHLALLMTLHSVNEFLWRHNLRCEIRYHFNLNFEHPQQKHDPTLTDWRLKAQMAYALRRKNCLSRLASLEEHAAFNTIKRSAVLT